MAYRYTRKERIARLQTLIETEQTELEGLKCVIRERHVTGSCDNRDGALRCLLAIHANRIQYARFELARLGVT
jgi:hypothetical protein